VVRPDGDTGRRAARRRGARIHQLHAAPGDRRQGPNFVFYANGNKASQEFIDKEILDDPAIYPNEATLAKLFTVVPYDPRTQRTVTRIWTKIVTGQ
jgi:hypothetical protein